MLPRENRLTAGGDFSRAVRAGRRAGSRTVVVHLLREGPSATVGPVKVGPARVGLVVGRQVGGAVVRNGVRRRLRHLLRERLARLPAGSLAVVRALPVSHSAPSAVLGADLDLCLDRLLRPSAAVTR